MAEDFASWLERLQDQELCQEWLAQEREEEMDRQQVGPDLEELLVGPVASPPSISRFPSGGRHREDSQNSGKVEVGVVVGVEPEPEPSEKEE